MTIAYNENAYRDVCKSTTYVGKRRSVITEIRLHGQPGPHQLDPGLAKYKVFHDLPARQVCMLSNQAEGQYDARRAACFPGSWPGSLNIDNYFFKLRR